MTSLVTVQSSPPALADGASLTVEPFAPNQVELLESPFKAAMERNAKYLLSLDADRLLHNTREYAGLQPKAPIYGGWESRGIAGHTLGHYLTALSQQYAATKDARFKQRIDYIISEMAECQKAYGDGYIGALPPLELQVLRDLKQGKVDMWRGWVPWYTQHKILAGLIDAWTLGENAQAKDVTLKLADWTDDITRNLTPDQVQQMLGNEFGGMNESLADIYALTGNKKYLEASHRFYHKEVMEPLLASRDELNGKHANTQIPKVIGEARLYEVAGDADGRKIAEYFWNEVVHHRSWAIGGNSDSEHFFPEGKEEEHLGPATAETCNTYNMLKLTRHLFEWQPKAEYFDFYERALYNHILASQEPKQGMFTYFVSLRPGHFKTYSTPDNSFWCCVGTGMENHTKYNDSIYFHGADDLYVNLFIPSRLNWNQKGLTVEQKTSYPNANTTELQFTAKTPVPLGLKVRCPQWATGGLKIQLNGKVLSVNSTPGSYTEVRRTWQSGDKLQITIPMTLRSEALSGAANDKAFLYGPIVLAGDLGPVTQEKSLPYAVEQWDYFGKPTAKVPVLVSTGGDVATAIKRASQDDLVFRINDADNKSVTLRPFNEIFYSYYNVYWNVLTPAQYSERKADMDAEAARQRDLAARTLDDYRPGEQQSEVDHNQQGEKSNSGDAIERKYRDAVDGGWFSFEQKVAPDDRNALFVTYWGDDAGNRTFDILVDGKVIATETLNRNKPGEFFEKAYAIPEDLTRGKQKVTVRFQAKPGNIAGGIFGAKTVKGPLPEKPTERLEPGTFDVYRPGEQQSEVDHNQQGEKSNSGDAFNRKYRDALDGGWFSFEMKAAAQEPVALVVTYWGGDAGNRTFDILVDGQKIASETLDNNKPGEFFEKTYAIPEELTRGKQKVTVRFQAKQGNIAGGIFGAKTVKR